MDVSKLIKHMAWANQEILAKVAVLPDEALDAYIVNPEWTVREIARHIASSATWYGWRLLDKTAFTDTDTANWEAKLSATEIPPASAKDIQIVMATLRSADQLLLTEAAKPEGEVVREWKGEIIVRKRSTILAQSIHHATEHRAQLVSALEFKGFTGINLDDYDAWNYADTIGE